MEQERIAKALARIEVAASRIEAAASVPSPASDGDLARRHEALKQETAAALADLDGLIGTLEA